MTQCEEEEEEEENRDQPTSTVRLDINGDDSALSEANLLALRAPINRNIPMEPHPFMGLHVVIPLHLHSSLSHPLNPSPPLTGPYSETGSGRPTRPNSGHTQPLDVPHLRHNLRRNPPLRRLRNPRNPLVLAPLQNPIPMAPLFPTRNPTLGSGLLLVLPLLPDPILPHAPHFLHHTTTSQAGLVPALQPLNPHLHLLPLARVLPIVPSPLHHPNDVGLLRRIRVPVLDSNRVAQRLLSFRAQLSDLAVGLQSCLPRRSAVVAFLQRWVPWDWRVDLQFRAQWFCFVTVLEVLC